MTFRRKLEKICVRLAGEDYEAYKQCAQGTRKNLLLIGALVVFIFVLTFLGIMEAFTEFFHSNLVGVVIGLFFAWIVSNMYLLLLYTLNRNVLVPEDRSVPSKVSFNIRLATVAFLGFMVSKPIEHFLFRSTIQEPIELIKAEKLLEIQTGIEENYQHMLLFVDQERKKKLTAKRDADLRDVEELIASNSYYIQGLKLINGNSSAWALTGFIVLLYCLPIFWKRSIPIDSVYYKNKRDKQVGLVLNAYSEFKELYAKTMSRFSKESLTFTETHVDPPFNLIRYHEELETQSEEEFIREVYGN
ncbi:MAG: DUF4407 domain-containing protein [Bacteroidia bacterium]|nr:DUF4407 domain-containing protein [Bacteroidia bacterium]